MILKIIKVETNIGIVTNSYIVFDEDTKEGMVIDPGGNVEKIMEMIETLGLNLKYIVATHSHLDHIMGINELKEKTQAKVLISRQGSENINNRNVNLAEMFEYDLPYIEVDSRVDDCDLIHVGDLEFKIILTPGHTNDGISLYCEKEKLVFTGDTLFARTQGRTDLPTGDYVQIMDSIRNRLLILPEDVMVYPGHGEPTTIGDEIDFYNYERMEK